MWLNFTSGVEFEMYRAFLTKRGAIVLKFMDEDGEWFASVKVETANFERVGSVFINIEKIYVGTVEKPHTVRYLGVFSESGRLFSLDSLGRQRIEAGYALLFDPHSVHIAFGEEAECNELFDRRAEPNRVENDAVSRAGEGEKG